MNKKEDFVKSYFNTFNQIFGIDQQTFESYYDESMYGGYPEEPGGSVWESEGKSIYVLIRIMKPKRILEIGNFLGRSSNHILQAVDKNGFGEVTLLDIEERLEYDKLHNRNFIRVLQDSLKFLDEESLNFDLVIQDGCHEYEHVKKELQLLTANSMNEFVMWSHDYFTIKPPQCEVAKAFDEVRSKFQLYLPVKDSVSNCGFIITKFKK